MERRVIFETAAIEWIRKQRPPLLQVIAVLEWAQRRRSSGPPDEAVPDPDPERPEDWITTIPMAKVDVRFGYYESPDGEQPILYVRSFRSH